MSTLRWLAAVTCLALMTSCRSYQSLEFRRIENGRMAHFDFVHPLVMADVVYYNPNNVGFNFKGGEVDVYLDSLWLGHALLDTTIHIHPRSEFTITLPMQLDLQRLIKSGVQTYLNRQVHVRVDGFVRASKGLVQKKFPIHFEGEQRLDLKLF
ncbi:LEA type 2 family protein [Dinghuibacter silviterrae]|uniref:Late embryogenesis abundant protein n=1 Tax=Dinghuibacter silviterrae TaxID=1539049 RepID=A0A4R8DIM6_9BACT|nr:LEA type 2 family protein [Dinghuibacter silviterrae]TDW97026.1 late embryogenesis abundant protein [Dinghuibacter silviterrae]